LGERKEAFLSRGGSFGGERKLIRQLNMSLSLYIYIYIYIYLYSVCCGAHLGVPCGPEHEAGPGTQAGDAPSQPENGRPCHPPFINTCTQERERREYSAYTEKIWARVFQGGRGLGWLCATSLPSPSIPPSFLCTFCFVV
jgi:hypothetical protein